MADVANLPETGEEVNDEATPRVYAELGGVTIWHGDARDGWRHLPERSVDAIVTSPPYYGLRDYGGERQLGLEGSVTEFIESLADLLTGYGTHTLKPGGSLWLNLGDTYSTRPGQGNGPGGKHRRLRAEGSLPPRDRGAAPLDVAHKSLAMIPERVVWALIERGWILRNKVVWKKPNAMPESVDDRLSGTWEHMFHLVRQPRYFYDLDAIREEVGGVQVTAAGGAPGLVGDLEQPGQPGAPRGKNPGDVWTIPTVPGVTGHIAAFPPELVRRPILTTVPEHVCRACGEGRRRLTGRPCDDCHAVVPRQAKECPNCGYRNTSWREGRDDREAYAVDPTGKTAGRGAPRNPGNYVNRTIDAGFSDCGCDAGWKPGTVLDPFFGSGTTAAMARQLGRHTVGIELNPDYCAIAASRFQQESLFFIEDAG